MKICTTVRKFPGSMVVTPLLIGCLVSAFVPQILEIGGFIAGLLKTGAFMLVGLLILCSDATINFKQVVLPLYKGTVLTILKYAIGVLLGLGLNRLFGPTGILGLTLLAAITAVVSSDDVIYTALAKEFGDNTDVEAIAILPLSNGSSLTMIALGTTGLAETPILSLVAATVPLVIGMTLDNLGEDFKMPLSNGLAILPSFNGFMLGVNTSLLTIAKAGVGDIALGPITVLFTGVLTYYPYSLIRRKPDPMGMAIGITGDSVVAVPISAAMANPSLEPVVGVATVQVAGAVVITAILTPILIEFSARGAVKRQQKD